MLGELYQYALDHDLSAQPGFKSKKVKYYLMLSADGRFLGLDPPPTPTAFCPDIGSKAQGSQCCNILVEKASIVLSIIEDASKNKNIPTKHQFFLDALQSGAEAEPLFGVAHRALSDPDTLEAMPRCLITGELAPAMATVPKVSGLFAVGGHPTGDAFLCFDKDAFQSYGLRQSANAAASEAAMTGVNAALTHLIASAKTFGGSKLVHWYSGTREPRTDPVVALFGDDLPPEEEGDATDESAEREALTAAGRLIESLNRNLKAILPMPPSRGHDLKHS